jgi:hypothetical protein
MQIGPAKQAQASRYRAYLKCLVIALSFVATTAFAQTTSPKNTSGTSIQGKVIQDPGRQPIGKANLELNRENRASEYSATTDSEGQFRIDDIKPGRYAVVIKRPGFVQRGGTRSISIAVLPGQATTDFIFHMRPAAVITGKIVDVDGDPMRGVFVIAHPVGSVSRGMSLREWFGADTNDLGEFRIPNLRAGQYTIEANPPDRKGGANEQLIYATTYYPGTLNKEQSVPLEIHAGGETPVNFGLQRSRVFSVSGTVPAVPGSGRPVFIRLNPKGSDLDNYANGGPQSANVGEGGKFEFPSLLPGSYTAQLEFTGSADGEQMRMKTLRASQPIEVSDADVEGLQLQPDVGGTVRGKLHMDTGQKFDWTQLIVFLLPLGEPEGIVLGDSGSFRFPPSVSPDGTFELKDVAGGTYQLVVGAKSNNLRDYFVTSVSMAGRDVADSGFPVGAETFLDVVISANGGTIEGTVEDSSGKPVAYAKVLDAPSAEHRARRDLYQQDTTDERGHFSLRGLNPGKYTAMAFEQLPGFPDDIRRPNFLTPYESQGQEIELGEGARRSVVLKVISTGVD